MANYQDALKDYVDVAERISVFREKYPNGSLQPANLTNPLQVIEIDGKTFVLYTACAYRTPDDPRPGVGIAWEPVPGATPYTRGSEAMNAETGAWGRAIVAVLAADTKRGIASAQEVNSRAPQAVDTNLIKDLENKIAYAKSIEELDAYADIVKSKVDSGQIDQNNRTKLASAYIAKKKKLEKTPVPPNVKDTLAELNAVEISEDPSGHIKAIQEQLKA
jgi:hypothetical protein